MIICAHLLLAMADSHNVHARELSQTYAGLAHVGGAKRRMRCIYMYVFMYVCVCAVLDEGAL
jgi:hypothetical protein